MQSKPMTESEVAKWVGKDKNLEWMPKNPCKIAMCDPIPNDDCVNCDISTAFPHYQSEIAALERLLDYLIENRFSGISDHDTDERVYLQRLRKQLEAVK